jgi:hypothetical protein
MLGEPLTDITDISLTWLSAAQAAASDFMMHMYGTLPPCRDWEQHLRVGRGMSRRPTPKMATAKKCMTRTEGLGLRPDSRDTGPAEYQPPKRR